MSTAMTDSDTITFTATSLTLRDFTVSVYSIASTLQFLMLVTVAKELYHRRTPLFLLATLLCSFGFSSAVSSFIYSTDTNAYCPIRGRLNGTLHLLSLTTIELILLAKMRAVNVGHERKLFTIIGVVWMLLRLGCSLANVILLHNEREGGPTGVCVSIFEQYSTYALNFTVVGTNLSLTLMFIYPLRAHIKRMWYMDGADGKQRDAAKHSFYQSLVDSGLKYSLMQSVFSTVAYLMIAFSVLGGYSISILYFDWCVSSWCTISMLLDSVKAASYQQQNNNASRPGTVHHNGTNAPPAFNSMKPSSRTMPEQLHDAHGYVPGSYNVYDMRQQQARSMTTLATPRAGTSPAENVPAVPPVMMQPQVPRPVPILDHRQKYAGTYDALRGV